MLADLFSAASLLCKPTIWNDAKLSHVQPLSPCAPPIWSTPHMACPAHLGVQGWQ